ncbi:MAG: hypothetical protein CVT92_02265 [Bacteroidetes bacterium HGW-Bacteroidetes-1]|jgi:SNF2 family DNA or RNA helicase|nr:MAG: hypothetical protein CVT92_02265 [Bacteroidetes bacterium HGW-Bacteroidetes-1]
MLCLTKSFENREISVQLGYNEKNHQITISEETNEQFLTVQDKCSYALCARFRNSKYEVPFIALPVLINRLKEIKYPIKFTDGLKEKYDDYTNHRKRLVELKERKYSAADEDVKQILNFILECELHIKERFFRLYRKDFQYYGNQVETIVYSIIGERIIIGNDIGTGKTLVALTVDKYLKKYGGVKKTLIMLPASLVENFYSDYGKFFGDGEMFKITTEPPKKREAMYQMFKGVSQYKTLITNYEKCNFDVHHLKNLSFDMIVVDEFHKMKNFISAQRSINFFQLVQDCWKPRYRYPMSGTPIENKLFDIYPVFKLLDDGKILGGHKFFETNFVEYEERQTPFRMKGSKQVFFKTEIVAVGFKNHQYVKNLIAPYIIKKKLDLPVKLYRHDVFVEPSARFHQSYIEYKKQFVGSARYVNARQFLCDTSRGGWDENPKFELLEDIIGQTSDKVIIFTFFKCGVAAIARKLKQLGFKYITCMGGDGKDALKVVQEFNNTPDIKALVTTDKINYGQNIQSARIVIEWDIPIKPAITMQRAGRAYRSGQDHDVHLYRFITVGTVEEIIHKQWETKKDLIDKVIESLGDDSSDDNLGDIVAEMEANILKQFEKEV